METSTSTSPLRQALRYMNQFWRITPLERAVRELEQAQLGRLTAAAHREWFAAAERMYNERISRLRVEVAAMTKEASSNE